MTTTKEGNVKAKAIVVSYFKGKTKVSYPNGTHSPVLPLERLPAALRPAGLTTTAVADVAEWARARGAGPLRQRNTVTS